jgi:hypothetical protein
MTIVTLEAMQDAFREIEKLSAALDACQRKSEQRKLALMDAYHIIMEHGTPTMRAHATHLNNMRDAMRDEE